jgi:hypothetical protein
MTGSDAAGRHDPAIGCFGQGLLFAHADTPDRTASPKATTPFQVVEKM